MKIAKTPIARYLPEHKRTIPGFECQCGAKSWSECGCEDVDWTDYGSHNELLDTIHQTDIQAEDICELDLEKVARVLDEFPMLGQIGDVKVLAQALKEAGVIRFSNRKEEGR